MKKALRETQTLRAGCSKTDPKNFAPPQTPFPGARDSQNLTSWRWSLPLPTDPVWWRSMHAISSYRGNRPTQTPTHKHRPPQTGPITIHCAAKLSGQCNDNCSSLMANHAMVFWLVSFVSDSFTVELRPVTYHTSTLYTLYVRWLISLTAIT